jgi:hypothetical protein
MWDGADTIFLNNEPEVSEEEIRQYIIENSAKIWYSCWGRNKWDRLTYRQARKVLIERKKKVSQ